MVTGLDESIRSAWCERPGKDGIVRLESYTSRVDGCSAINKDGKVIKLPFGSYSQPKKSCESFCKYKGVPKFGYINCGWNVLQKK